MRLFFALQPDRQACLDIATFRERMLPPLDRPVPVANLHVTLAFLGEVDEPRVETLCGLAQDIQVSPFELTFDELGYWSRARILWVGASETPEALLQLVSEIASVARRLQLPRDKRPYRPHITIARRCKTPPPAGALPPRIRETFNTFALFESVNTRGGVRYDPIAWFGTAPDSS